MENLNDNKYFLLLKEYFIKNRADLNLKNMFKVDGRFARYSETMIGPGGRILIDYSKNFLNKDIFDLLINLAKSRNVEGMIKSMFKGDKINSTEKRAVLHVALRNLKKFPMSVDNMNVMDSVFKELDHMERFSDEILSGKWKGYTGKPITDIVNIGIGGSHLGPYMVTEALKPYAKLGMSVHFVSNIDGSDLFQVLKKVSTDQTMFIVASKTFTTQETITNAISARKWFLEAAKDAKHIEKHFVAVSTNKKKVEEFGMAKENMFVMWDVSFFIW
ncbi:hypothetical protein A3Q56_04011 [Intoshia linei]|uniref:Glucose-6-phosphate isomerase n=1 Tax=Intoshia linei TaxID=1819745 RepID=A0A177B285_9BILA|nr:hypothetical protein A3Q56_04011 [Intoshia linei]